MSDAHDCPVAGCEVRIPRSRLMCKRHWYRVPKELRDRVWRAARRMWAADDLGGSAYEAWRELRDEAVAYVEQREAERA